MKAQILAAAAGVFGLAAPAFAGPYVNIETNSGFSGGDYSATLLETHLGFEGPIGTKAGYYVQGGPAINLPDNGDSTTELSGKVGVNVAATDNLGFYGEVAAATTGEIDFDADLNVNVKAGVKYTF